MTLPYLTALHSQPLARPLTNALQTHQLGAALDRVLDNVQALLSVSSFIAVIQVCTKPRFSRFSVWFAVYLSAV